MLTTIRHRVVQPLRAPEPAPVQVPARQVQSCGRSGRATRWLVALLVAALATAVPAGALAQAYGSRALMQGSAGPDVTDLQLRLYALGYLPHPPDATFGPTTWGALAAFQRDAGLAPSGAAGLWTVSVLDRAYAWHIGIWHTVAAGESLAGIAAAHGTSAAVLRWLNRLPRDTVQPGQRLRVPQVRTGAGGGAGGSPGGVATGADAGKPPPPDPGPVPDPEPPEDPTPPADPTPRPAEPDPPPTPVPDPPPVAAGGRPLVFGYYAEDWPGDPRALHSLQQAAGRVDAVVTFQFLTDAAGNLIATPMPDLLTEARRQGIPVLGLVHNYAGGTFDRDVARQLLATPASRAAAAARISDTLIAGGFDGINVDIENVPPELRDGYTDFVRLLAEQLRPAGLAVTLSIPAKVADNRRDGWSGGFDYAALGQLADLIVLMTYDQHLPGYAPGPVAGYEWVERVLGYATGEIAPERLLMGVPAYAYDWVAGTSEARGLSVPVAQRLAQREGAAVAWDAAARSPYFTYRDTTGRDRIVYFDNADSVAHKLTLVHTYGLRGIAIWRLGYEDPAIWPVITAALAAPAAGPEEPDPAPGDAPADPRAAGAGGTGSRSG